MMAFYLGGWAMRLLRTGIAVTDGRRPRLSDPSVDQARSNRGRSVSIIIAGLAILMMVVL
jgi:hypothetical protein